MAEKFLWMPVILLCFDLVQHRLERFLHISDQTPIQTDVPAKVFAAAIYLNDGRLFGAKLRIGKTSAQH